MPGPNTTGTPNTQDYNLGRGIIYFAEIDDTTGLPQAYRDLGNAPAFSVALEVETLEHQSSREGLRVTDKEVTISQTANVTFTLDELNFENLAEFFAGARDTHVNAAIAGFASWQMIQNVEMGRWYDIVDSDGNRAYDVDADDLTVNNDATSDDLVLDTDYELDSEMGRIFFKSTATGIDAGDEVHVTLAARALASPVTEVQGLTRTTQTGALKFISENPANEDKRTEFQFHQIKLKANGDFALIGDDWSQMEFQGKAERNTRLAGSPTLTIRNVTAPTATE